MLMHEKTCVIPIVVYRFKCMALLHSKARRHMIIMGSGTSDALCQYFQGKGDNKFKMINIFEHVKALF